MLLVRAIAAALAVLALSGCGGPGPAAEARGGRVEITLDDFLIRPQLVRAAAGEVTFAAGNRGRLPHNFRVRGRGGEPVAIATLLPGERASETAVLRRGEYKILCTVGNHEELGMYGRLVVR
jgi:plastocyanin